MRKWLEQVRKPYKKLSISKSIIISILILLLGIALGIFSKWLDNLSINDGIWWQHILGTLDLRNVFSEFGIWVVIAVCISVFSNSPLRASINVFLFFIGMTGSYHLYTVMFSGFNPASYMKIWYTMTLITPILAYICWYAKGKGKISLVISAVIIAVGVIFFFSIGSWYFYFKSAINTLLFVVLLLVLYSDYKKSIISLILAIMLAFLFRVFI